jgi:predicted  nucleic acid-binding Zn-ribbon protein
MLPDLKLLIELQALDSTAERLRRRMADIPGEQAALDSRLADLTGAVNGVKERIAASQTARREIEKDLAAVQTRLTKYKDQLMEVKTNKEYTAMLHEIEGVEREIRAREDLVLAEMEKAETLGAEIKREESLFKSSEQDHRARAKGLGDEETRLRAEAGRLSGERDAEAARLPAPVLELFQRVARLRGVAVAEARDGMCQVCHLKLRPQMYVDLKRNEQIVQCPACNRILYFEAPPPVSSPVP